MLAFFVNSVKFEQHMSVSRSIFQSLYTSRSVKLLKLFSQQSRPSEETLQKKSNIVSLHLHKIYVEVFRIRPRKPLVSGPFGITTHTQSTRPQALTPLAPPHTQSNGKLEAPSWSLTRTRHLHGPPLTQHLNCSFINTQYLKQDYFLHPTHKPVHF